MTAQASPAAQSRRGRLSLRQREALAGYTFLIPWIIGLLFFTLGPILAVFYFSFTNYPIIGAPEWIGFGNYRRMFFRRSPLCKVSLQHRLLCGHPRAAVPNCGLCRRAVSQSQAQGHALHQDGHLSPSDDGGRRQIRHVATDVGADRSGQLPSLLFWAAAPEPSGQRNVGQTDHHFPHALDHWADHAGLPCRSSGDSPRVSTRLLPSTAPAGGGGCFGSRSR